MSSVISASSRSDCSSELILVCVCVWVIWMSAQICCSPCPVVLPREKSSLDRKTKLATEGTHMESMKRYVSSFLFFFQTEVKVSSCGVGVSDVVKVFRVPELIQDDHSSLGTQQSEHSALST